MDDLAPFVECIRALISSMNVNIWQSLIDWLIGYFLPKLWQVRRPTPAIPPSLIVLPNALPTTFVCPRDVGRRCMAVRRRKRLGIDEVSHRSGIPIYRLVDLEEGRESPLLGEIDSLAWALGVPVRDLIALEAA